MVDTISNQDVNSFVEQRYKHLPNWIKSLLKFGLAKSPRWLISGISRVKNIPYSKQYLYKYYYTIPKKSGLNTHPREKKIIVSLTTIPSRIKYVPYVLGAMMRQTMKPDKIILNLGDDKFSSETIPKSIRKFQKKGVDVEYVTDLKPHTKYFYSLQKYPSDIVITVDDDMLYPLNLIEKLYQSYEKHPNAVSCFRAHKILFNSEGFIIPYNDWKWCCSDKIDTPSMDLFCTAVFGVLYPPECMHNELFNISALKELSYFADDVWLKFMQIMQNTPVVVVQKYQEFPMVAQNETQKTALFKRNVSENANDIQIRNVLNRYNTYYGDNDTLLQRIKKE